MDFERQKRVALKAVLSQIERYNRQLGKLRPLVKKSQRTLKLAMVINGVEDALSIQVGVTAITMGWASLIKMAVSGVFAGYGFGVSAPIIGVVSRAIAATLVNASTDAHWSAYLTGILGAKFGPSKFSTGSHQGWYLLLGVKGALSALDTSLNGAIGPTAHYMNKKIDEIDFSSMSRGFMFKYLLKRQSPLYAKTALYNNVLVGLMTKAVPAIRRAKPPAGRS